MMKFRIFCELLAKMMLETIDFTMVFRGYRRNEKPKRLGIATIRYQLHQFLRPGRNEKPKRLGIATFPFWSRLYPFLSRNEKSERLGIATK